MSKICLVTGAEGPRLKHRQLLFDMLKQKGVIRPDTILSNKTIARKTTVLRPYAETLYFGLLQSQYTIEGCIQAEKEGLDAAMIGCYFDPGLEAAREVCKIPVVGIAEASLSFAAMLARKKHSFAVIAVADKGVPKTYDVIEKYGLADWLIDHQPVRNIPIDMYVAAAVSGKQSAMDTAKNEYIKIARACIADGAELIITGCGGLGPMLATEGLFEIDGVPVLDPVTCAIKMAEGLIDLKKLGISVSRRMWYKPPTEEEFKRERAVFGF